MRRGLVVVIAVLSVASFVLAPSVYSDTVYSDTTVPTSTTVALIGGSESLDAAARGTVAQITPTLPPPPTTQAPYVAPARSPYEAPFWSGYGRRVVYSKGSMYVWMIDAAERVVRSYPVSGRLNQPDYGTYYVYSRSTYTCNIDHTNVCMRWMVRFATGPKGDNIGFHEIPREDGVPIQSDAQLGTPLSSGCVRQSTADAMAMWDWAPIGTKVVVIP